MHQTAFARGFIVAPPELVDGFLSARALADWSSSAIDQAVLAQFIDRGMLVRHLRRMRMLYAERQRVLIETARQWLGDWIEIEEQPTGLHAVGWLNRLSEKKVMQAAEVAQVELRPMSMYRVGPSSREAVLFGFAPFDASATGAAVLRLREALDRLRS
jgi:GntR family transcriptional regulator/MocR family aminotransferase